MKSPSGKPDLGESLGGDSDFEKAFLETLDADGLEQFRDRLRRYFERNLDWETAEYCDPGILDYLGRAREWLKSLD